MAYSAISDFKGIHQGKRLFILASGPSLADIDLTKLQRRMVMGLNRSCLIYPDTDYHCCFDLRLFEMYEELLQQTRYLFTIEGRPWGIALHSLAAEGYSWDLEQGIYTGYTIAYFALQIAVYMGFKQIFYLGLDLKNDQHNTHFFGHDWHSRNHDTTEFPKMKRMFEYGLKRLACTDVHVYNCSPVCELDCLKYAPFDWAISL